MKVGAGRGIIEPAGQAADMCAPSGRGKAAAFREEVDLGNAGCPAMTDDLDHAGHGISAVESAFSAVDNFDLVDVVEGEVGEVKVPAGKIDGSAIYQDFCESRIASVNKDGGEPPNCSRARKADAVLRGEKVRKRNRLALLDFLQPDDINRGWSPGKLRWPGVGGDDDVGGKRREVEVKIQSARFGGSEVDDGLARRKR